MVTWTCSLFWAAVIQTTRAIAPFFRTPATDLTGSRSSWSEPDQPLGPGSQDPSRFQASRRCDSLGLSHNWHQWQLWRQQLGRVDRPCRCYIHHAVDRDLADQQVEPDV